MNKKKKQSILFSIFTQYSHNEGSIQYKEEKQRSAKKKQEVEERRKEEVWES